MATDADRIRLAIALSALNFKPPNQSFSSYALDLQSKFPPSNPTSDQPSWRSFALSLEHDYAKLQAKYEAEKIKTLGLENAASSVPAPIPNPGSEPPASSKKKVKKKSSGPDKQPTVLPMRLDLKSILEKLHDRTGMNIPAIAPRDSLFSALDDVMQLTSLTHPEAHPDLLLSTIGRAVEAAAQILETIVVRQTPNVPSDLKTLETLGLLMHYTLDTALHLLLPSPTHLTALLDKTAPLVLNRLINAFGYITQIYLDDLFISPSAGNQRPQGGLPERPTASVPPPTDIRVDMLSLFRTVFCALDVRLQSLTVVPSIYLAAHTLRATLTLETVRALERLLSPPLDSSSPGPVTYSEIEENLPQPRYRTAGRPERVKRLVIKDTLWYLCAVLHILFSVPSAETLFTPQSVTVPVMNDHDSDRNEEALWGREWLLNEKLSNALLGLLRKCKRTTSSSGVHQTHLRGPIDPRFEIEGEWEICSRHVEIEEGHLEKEGKEEQSRSEIHTSGGSLEGAEADITEGGCQPDLDEDADAEDGFGAPGQANCKSRGVLLLSQCQETSGVAKIRDEGTYDLDEVGYGMLLGVLERYWVWRRCWETENPGR